MFWHESRVYNAFLFSWWDIFCQLVTCCSIISLKQAWMYFFFFGHAFCRLNRSRCTKRPSPFRLALAAARERSLCFKWLYNTALLRQQRRRVEGVLLLSSGRFGWLRSDPETRADLGRGVCTYERTYVCLALTICACFTCNISWTYFEGFVELGCWGGQ